jgi:hypothetical protein
MKTLFAAVLLFGSNVGAMAVESYADYRDDFDAKAMIVERAPRRGSEKAYRVDTRRYDEGNSAPTTRDLRPRNWDGGYVPTLPRSASPDGFWSPFEESSRSRDTRDPYTGTLGTRR